MRLTKLGHSCVRLEKDGATLVIDPGIWSGPGALDGASAVLVTHEHPDHLDADAIGAALTASSELELWSNASVASRFAGFGDRAHQVGHGDTFTAAGFDVHVYGEKHALIHRDIPIIANTGFAVDGQVFHPGDALTEPEDRIPTLLVPVNAPWLKIGEMIDYARAVSPERGFAIHDSLMNENGLNLIGNLLPLAQAPGGGPVTRLEPGTSVEL
ncbi:MAG: MBL fold metallo-hydrolase [Streptosporangiaceae bacterium]|jgi:L-ascorbate metabolism protein UlaG (beta-lactamase superfamily)|nr:MBL fold metallo-hydrolase [Actinomycetota bacterium]